MSWLLLLCSVGSNSSELITDIIKRNFHNVENIKLFKFSYFRSGAVLVIFLTLLILLFDQKKFIKIKKINFEDIFIICFIIYLVSGFIGLNYSCNYDDNYLNILNFTCENGKRKNFFFTIHFLIASTSLILIYFFCSIQKIKFFYIIPTLALLLFISTLSFFLIILNKLEYGGITLNINFLNFSHYINSNGVGRIILILLVIFQSFYFSNYIKKNINKLLYNILITICSIIIFSLEGKYNILAMISFFFIFNFYVSIDNIKFKIYNTLTILILPIIIVQSNIILEKNIRPYFFCTGNIECEKNYIYLKKYNSNRILDIFNVRELNLENKNFENPENPSSPYLNSRDNKWKYLLNDFFKRKYLIGNGPEYDRQLLINLAYVKGANKTAVNSDAANGLIYGLLTSGIAGLILYIYSIIYTVLICLRYHHSKNQKSILLNFSILCLFLVITRSLIENGFMSWNLDQFLLISSLLIIKFKSKEILSVKSTMNIYLNYFLMLKKKL